MRLRTQVVNFIGLYLLHNANQVAGVRQITVMQFEASILNVRVLVNVVNALCVEQTRTPLDAMYFIAFFQKKLSQVRTILTGNARDQGNFGLLVCSR